MNPQQPQLLPNARGPSGPMWEHFIRSILNSGDSVKMLESLTVLQDWVDRFLPGPLDYKTAINRINNARRFLESHEAGAARYEIRMLMQSVQPQFEPG